MMENAENFAVAQAQHKKHLRSITFNKSISFAKTQPMVAPGKEGMKAMLKSNEIKNFEGLIEGENTSQEDEVPNMFDPVEDLNLEEKANKV